MKKQVQDVDYQNMDPYKLDKASKIPSWIIVLILKYWAAAAAVYFILFDYTFIDYSSMNSEDPISNLAVSFVVIILITLFLALFNTYIVRPYVRLMHNRRNNTFRYNMINVKGFIAFLLNLLYMIPISLLLTFITVRLGNYGLVLNLLDSGGTGIEPFTFGLWFVLVDGVFIVIKNLIIMAHERIKYNKQIKEA